MPDELGDEGRLINAGGDINPGTMSGETEVTFDDNEAEPIVADPSEVEAIRYLQDHPPSPPNYGAPLPPGGDQPGISAGPDDDPTFGVQKAPEDQSEDAARDFHQDISNHPPLEDYDAERQLETEAP